MIYYNNNIIFCLFKNSPKSEKREKIDGALGRARLLHSKFSEMDKVSKEISPISS